MKRYLPDVLCIVIFLLISIAYFLTPLSQSLVLGGHDSVAAIGIGQEQKAFGEAHDGEVSRWANNIFSGMPTYQTAPKYTATTTLSKAQSAYGLFTAEWFPAVNYLFLYLLGFYILLRAFNFKPYLAALGAVVWAFSSYFLIIIAAGHLWKAMTLAFIPPTIGGLILCYRGRYLKGAAVTALFTAFQVLSNHLQMTYYFLFVMLFIVIAYFVDAIIKKTLPNFAKATLAAFIAGLLGVAANLPNLYHTARYAQHTMRGAPELTTPAASASEMGGKATDGLDRDYITMWSYGIDETLTLLIPDFCGGGSDNILNRKGVDNLKAYPDFYNYAGRTQQILAEAGQEPQLPGLNQYWGNQPMTVGPVYVGAAIVFLAVLALFVVSGPVKWALFAATLLGFVFAWGKNIPGVTNFIIDNLPLYAKFRTVSSALVIAEFTLPLLAVLAVAEIIKRPSLFNLADWRSAPLAKKVGLPVAAVLTLGLCLLLWLAPSMAGDCLSAADRTFFAEMLRSGLFPADMVLGYQSAVTALHREILSADALRSALFIIVAMLLLAAYGAGKLRAWMLCTLLAGLCLADLWQIDKRYLNDASFADPVAQQEGFAKSPADEFILADTGYYRVCNLSAGNPFNETSNATAYYHHSVGGYHAAKLRRYQDLIDHRLQPELTALVATLQTGGSLATLDSIAPCLGMLNTKYYIYSPNAAPIVNPAPNGPAWFVSELNYVKNADAEMAALSAGFNSKRQAVADERFRSVLGEPFKLPAKPAAADSLAPQAAPGRVSLTGYDLNALSYGVESPEGGLVVFSEVYYPDWTATLDGKPIEIGRVNYLLRAVRVPAGKHELRFECRPASIAATNGAAFAAMALILLLGGVAVWRGSRKPKAAGNQPADGQAPLPDGQA